VGQLIGFTLYLSSASLDERKAKATVIGILMLFLPHAYFVCALTVALLLPAYSCPVVLILSFYNSLV